MHFINCTNNLCKYTEDFLYVLIWCARLVRDKKKQSTLQMINNERINYSYILSISIVWFFINNPYNIESDLSGISIANYHCVSHSHMLRFNEFTRLQCKKLHTHAKVRAHTYLQNCCTLNHDTYINWVSIMCNSVQNDSKIISNIHCRMCLLKAVWYRLLLKLIRFT